MPPRRKKDTGLSPADILKQMAQEARQASEKPNIYNYQPHYKQQIFHSSDMPQKIFLGGNRSGKTYGGVSEDVIRLTKDTRYMRFDYEEPTRGRVVAVDLVRGVEQILLPYFRQFIPPSKLINGAWEDSYQAGRGLLTLADNSFVEFMSYEQSTEKFAGTSRHFVHFDEEPPKMIWQECRARLVDTKGVWYMTMTPVEGATWVFDDLYDPASLSEDKEILVPGNANAGIAPVWQSKENSLLVVEVEMGENPHLDEEAQKLFFMGMSEEDKRARQKGEFVSAGGRIFPNFSVLTHTIEGDIDPRKLQLDGWQIYTSTDHGWSNPSAWLWHAVSHTGEVITFGEIYRSQTLIEELAREVHEKEAQWGLDTESIVRTGDPAMHQHTAVTGTTIIMEYADRGLYIYTDSVPREHSAAIMRMQAYFKLRGEELVPMWRIHRSCVNFIKELRKIQFKPWTSRKVADQNNKREEVLKKDDHAFDSAKYFASFLHDLRPDAPPVEKKQRYNEHDLISYDRALVQMTQEQNNNGWEVDSGWNVVESY